MRARGVKRETAGAAAPPHGHEADPRAFSGYLTTAPTPPPRVVVQGSRSPSPEGMDCEAHVWAVGGRLAAAQAHGAAGGGGGHLDPFQEPADCYVGGGGSRLARLEELGGSAPLSKLRRASLGASDQPGGLLARRAALLCAAAAAAGDGSGSGAAAESPDHLRRKALLNSTAHLRQSPSSSSSSSPPSPPSGWRKYSRRRSAPSVMSTGTLITAAAEVVDCAAAAAAWAAGYRPTPRSVRSSSLSAEDVDAMCV